MKVRRNVCCIHCGKPYIPSPRLSERQKTCGSKECKRLQNLSAQKRWKKKNRKLYLQNQKDWRTNHPGFWKGWRIKHPEYVARNRAQSRIRKSLSKTGLQKKLDILQLTKKQGEFWNLPRFVKLTRSLCPLLAAYKRQHDERYQSRQKSQSP